MMWNRKPKRVPVDLINAWEAAAIREKENRRRARPNTIEEYLALSVAERTGAFLQASLITELCEAVVTLRALQEKL